MGRPLVALVLILVGVFSAAAPLRAQDASGEVRSANLMLARLAAADPDLQTYRADVAFELGLRTVPYLRKTVHGNAYFQRPARMELVFSDLPSYARSWSNLYVGL